jgi:hypothetical protein
MWFPYDDSKVNDFFSKEKDFLLKLDYTRVVIAGLFNNGVDGYQWITSENCRVIPRDRITDYMSIPD